MSFMSRVAERLVLAAGGRDETKPICSSCKVIVIELNLIAEIGILFSY